MNLNPVSHGVDNRIPQQWSTRLATIGVFRQANIALTRCVEEGSIFRLIQMARALAVIDFHL